PATPTVALTFDDGPNGRCTEAVLDALRDVGAPGTFFVLGENVARGQDDALLARMVREGHTIGVHSETHGVRPLFLRGATAEELRAARAAVDAALARAGIAEQPAVALFRPPFGLLTEAAARAAAQAGFLIVEWTVSVADWEGGRGPRPRRGGARFQSTGAGGPVRDDRPRTVAPSTGGIVACADPKGGSRPAPDPARGWSARPRRAGKAWRGEVAAAWSSAVGVRAPAVQRARLRVRSGFRAASVSR